MTNTVQSTFSRSLVGAVVAGAFALTAGVASAASCSIDTVGFELDQNVVTPSLLNGVGCYTGNDKQTGSQVRNDGWTLGYSTDGGFAAGPVAGLNISGIGATTGPGGWSITWSNPAVSYGSLLLTIKQGNSFAGYLLDLAGLPTLSGTWETSGPGGAHNSISHFSVWY